MTHTPRRLWAAFAIALLGLGGLGYWHLRLTKGFEHSAVSLDETVSNEAPNEDRPEPSTPKSRVEPAAGEPARTRERSLTKAVSLNKTLERRPPALSDLGTVHEPDPERHQRYSMRAARAERLNQRLSQRIETLEATLANASNEEQSAISAELAQLKANLNERQALERAAYPTAIKRPAP
jgi:hypothetical protein